MMKKFFIGLILFFVHGIIAYFPRGSYGFWSIQQMLISLATAMLFAWIFQRLTKSK